MKSSLYLVIEEIRKKKKNKTKQKQMLHYETRHVSVMTTAATLKTLLNKIMIAIFNHWEFFVSGETEIWLFFFPKVYSLSIFLGPDTPPSQVFRFALASTSLAILSVFFIAVADYLKVESSRPILSV